MELREGKMLEILGEILNKMICVFVFFRLWLNVNVIRYGVK